MSNREYSLLSRFIGRTGKKKLPYEAAADSFTGLVRKRNEDSFVYAWDPDCRHLLAAVADGIGSTMNGDIAGNYTLQLLVQAWQKFKVPEKQMNEAVQQFLYDTIRIINRKLYDINSLVADGIARDSLGTTLTAAVFLDKSVVIANAGDSPMFQIRSGHIQQLTFSHNLVNELMRMGKISQSEHLTPDRGHMLTRYIGPKNTVEPECYVAQVRKGDCFVLCSDGLTLHVEEQEIAQVVSDRKKDLSAALKDLFCRTIRRGAKDNATMILVRTV